MTMVQVPVVVVVVLGGVAMFGVFSIFKARYWRKRTFAWIERCNKWCRRRDVMHDLASFQQQQLAGSDIAVLMACAEKWQAVADLENELRASETGDSP